MIQSGFGEAISFSPSVRFTLMHVYEYGDKVKLVSVIYTVIRLKKCRVMGMIRWKKCNEFGLFA